MSKPIKDNPISDAEAIALLGRCEQCGKPKHHTHNPEYLEAFRKAYRMSLTKQDIDALIDELRPVGGDWTYVRVEKQAFVYRDALKRTLYLAAGLAADGQRKPERVRCWLWSYLDGKPFHMAFNDPTDRISVGEDERLTPGWFVPDEETP